MKIRVEPSGRAIWANSYARRLPTAATQFVSVKYRDIRPSVLPLRRQKPVNEAQCL
jgi:hypothetical protein